MINESKKIVFFDIDGTIYGFNEGIPKSTKTAINMLKENGHIPVICTGRTKSMVFDIFINVGFDYVIAGAGTYVEHNGKELFYKKLEADKAKEIITAMWKYKFCPVLEGKNNVFMHNQPMNLTQENVKAAKIYEEALGEKLIITDITDTEKCEISKISGFFTDESDADGIINELGSKYNIVNHNNGLLEFIPEGFSKAKGIEVLIKYLGISRKNTYAFGDSFNDLEMLQYVEYGVAMGNSSDKLKELTKYSTTDFDKDGIYNALKEFGLI